MTNPESTSPAVPQDSNLAALEQAEKKIKSAWVAACISGTITLAVTLLAISGTSILNFSAWELFDVALIFGLAFGIFRKNRTCAVLMLVYFVAAKILLMVEAGKPNGLLLAIIFIYYFWQGVSGTFAFHRLQKAMPSLQSAGPN